MKRRLIIRALELLCRLSRHPGRSCGFGGLSLDLDNRWGKDTRRDHA